MMKKSFLLICFLCSIVCNAQTPPITPSWAFSHIVWEDSLNTSKGTISLIDSYMKREIPVSAVIIDSP